MNATQNSKPVATVLVIDDDRKRDATYATFFKLLSDHADFLYQIKPVIAGTPRAAIRCLLAREPCLVVLDMMLDVWDLESDEIYEAMSRTQCPMGLLSLDFNTQAASKSANKVLSKLKAVPKLGFWPFKTSIERYCKGLTTGQPPIEMLDDPVSVWNLTFQEAQGHGKHWQPHISGEVTFLHLTDTHFGSSTPDYMDVVAISNGANGGNNEPVASPLVADFLLWTGDITNRGLPSEFGLALKFASEITQADFLQKASPISIVPGNHDLCRPLALSSRMSSEDIPTEQKVKPTQRGTTANETSKHKRWVVKDTSVSPELWQYGTQPFRDFYAELVGEPAPPTSVGFRWHPQWAHLGFAVFELPIEAHVVQSDESTPNPPAFVSNKEFTAITNSAIKSFQDSGLDSKVCIIFLIHGRLPDQPKSVSERWASLVDRIEEAGHPTIIFGGHEHVATHLLEGRRLTVIGVPHDKNQTLGTSTLPGVGFIRLLGLGTSNLKLEITKVQKGTGHTNPDKWVQLTSNRFEIGAVAPHHWGTVNQFS